MMILKTFLAWMDRAPAELRAGAVEPMVRTYLRPDLPADERRTLETVLTTLLDDPAPLVRQTLAEVLSGVENAPRHLVLALCDDLPAIAEPLLRWSPCVIDAELIAALGGGVRAQQAIANRPWLSEGLASAVAGTAERSAVIALAGNPGAEVYEATVRTILDRFPGDGEIRRALLARPDLPIASRHALVADLGARLGDLVVARGWLGSRRAETVLRECCDRATLDLAAEAASSDLPALMEHLRLSGQLTPMLLIRAACEGEMRLLGSALALLSGVSPRKVSAIMADGREAALSALLAGAGLPKRIHPAIAAALTAWRRSEADGGGAGGPGMVRDVVEAVLERYRPEAGDDDVLALLRRLHVEAAREAARSAAEEAKETRLMIAA